MTEQTSSETLPAAPAVIVGLHDPVSEREALLRRACGDPGAFTPRRKVRWSDGYLLAEDLTRWQARAALVALDGQPEPKPKRPDPPRWVRRLRRSLVVIAALCIVGIGAAAQVSVWSDSPNSGYWLYWVLGFGGGAFVAGIAEEAVWAWGEHLVDKAVAEQ